MSRKTRKARLRRAERVAKAKQFKLAACRVEPGQASKYIGHAKKKIRPGDKVVLCLRVSQRSQFHNRNLDDHEANLRRVARRLGAVVVDVVRYVGSGWDPFWLGKAAAIARQHGASLLAETTDRLIRHPAYHSQDNPDAQARDSDLREMQDFTDGVLVLTDLHPDASPSKVRSYQRKRGQWAKHQRGGRPKNNKAGYKKERRKAVLPRVLEMRRRGATLGDIVALAKVPKMTASDWIRRYL